MPFKFKLSKRLALLKASLAATAALALACDRTDLTAPHAFPSPLTAAVTSLPTVAVVASGDDGNIPQNTLDNNLATRWSADGDGQWIRYDLGAVVAIDRVDIAWYLGDTRSTSFDMEVSPDAVIWSRVFTGKSSGRTIQPESYPFPTASGRYVRIVGHGSSVSTWNSITEVAINPALTSLPVVTVGASADDGNIPQNTLDNNLATRWSADGDGQSIVYDLGALAAIARVSIAWHVGNTRVASFAIEVSPDAVTWTRAFTGQSRGQTLEPESYDFPTTSGRYVRIVGHGSSVSTWNSITEVAIYGTTALRQPPLPTPTSLSAVSVVASGHDGNIPQNTLDNSLATRWSADGDGQWISYDLGALAAMARVSIAWHVGNTRVASFAIEVSPDAVTWTRAFTGQSSGQTLEPESYDFPTTSGRYVRIVGHGTSLNSWNSLTEVDLYGTMAQPPVGQTPVAQVRVTTASPTLLVAGTRQLVATLMDASGNVLSGRPVTWSSGAPAIAAVSSTGLVTGRAIGAVTITATSEGKSGTAAVTVTIGGASNHIGSPDLEPGLLGRTDLVLFEDFEYADWLNHWSGGYMVDQTYVSRTTSPVFRGSQALEVRVPNGGHYGVELDFAFAKKGLAEPDQIYLRYYVRFNDTWQKNGDGEIGKLPGFGGTYGRCGWSSGPVDGTCWSARMMNWDTGTGNQIGFYVYHMDGDGQYGSPFRWQPALTRGEWHCVEAQVKLNSLSGGTANYDGVLRGWIDGAPAFERTNLRFRNVSSTHIEKIWWNIYVGGQWTADRNMAINFDNVVIAQQRIGCN
jgi:hypothetical protein